MCVRARAFLTKLVDNCVLKQQNYFCKEVTYNDGKSPLRDITTFAVSLECYTSVVYFDEIRVNFTPQIMNMLAYLVLCTFAFTIQLFY